MRRVVDSPRLRAFMDAVGRASHAEARVYLTGGAAWRERSPFIAKNGALFFHHYDFFSQALSKLERRHRRDLEDVNEMFERQLIDGDRLAAFFAAIEPQLYRYPAIDPRAFRAAVEHSIAGHR